jgi:peptidoglycan/LPS O-acetylase OafA/YrhL
VLRGIAATAVVLCHSSFTPDDTSWWFRLAVCQPFRFGFLGVSLFVVLSGFCIHLAVAKTIAGGASGATDWLSFWRRRFYRLYPPYLAAIAFSLAVTWLTFSVAGNVPAGTTSFGWDLTTHLFMIHNLFRDYALGLHNSVFWSLGMEEQLYVLFAAYLLFRRRCGVRGALAIAAAVTLAWRCWLVGVLNGTSSETQRPLELGSWSFWPFAFWFSWVLGAIAAEAHAGAIRLPRWCRSYWTCIAVTTTALLASDHFTQMVAPRGRLAHLLGVADLTPYFQFLHPLSEPLFAAGMFVLLNRWVQCETAGGFRGPLVRRLAFVGTMSFSLYLVHKPLFHRLGAFLPAEPTLSASTLRLAVELIAAFGCSALFFWLVERHFLIRPASRRKHEEAQVAPVVIPEKQLQC